MSKELLINGKTYYPSAVLAGRFSYTQDYLGKLAREEKIDATRVGRKWFIEETSLKNFVEEVEVEKQKRSQQIRDERKRERLQFEAEKPTAINSLPTPPPQTASVVSVGSNSFEEKSGHGTMLALTQSVVVVMCGLLVGVLGFAAVENNVRLADAADSVQAVASSVGGAVEFTVLSTGKNQQAFLDFSAFLNWLFGSSETVVENDAERAQSTNQVQAQTNNAVSGRSALVMIDGRSTTSVEDIRSSFSDETEVTFDGPDTGMVKPVFRNRSTEESYRFLLVPVVESEG